MIEKLDMGKLQNLVYYINNVKMGSSQRDALNRVIIGGIIRGEIDTDDICIGSVSPDGSTIEEFMAYASKTEREGWIKSADLYQKYLSYCESIKKSPECLTSFVRVLVSLGLNRKKAADANYYYVGEADGGE